MKQFFSSGKSLFAAMFFLTAVVATSQEKFPAIDVNGKKMQVRTESNFTSFSSARENRSVYAQFNGAAWAMHPEFGKLPYNGDFAGYVEVLEKRTVNSRYFVNAAKPTEFKSQSALGALHFRRNDQWVTIDSRISDKGNGIFEASEQWDPVGFDMNQSLSYIKTQAGTVYFNRWALFGMDKEGNRQKLAVANWSNYTAGDDGIYVYNIFPGIDASMTTRRGGIKTNFIVKQMNFGQYDQLLFKDEFVMPLGSEFKFKQEAAHVTKAKGEVQLLKGGVPVLEIGEAVSYLKSDPRSYNTTGEYLLEGSNLVTAVSVEWIKQTIAKGDVVIDPLVTSSGSIAQLSITGSMYNNTPCMFSASCNYNLAMNTPAQATFTDIKWSFDYLATFPCFMQDGGIKIGLGACTSPSAAGFYWYCNAPSSGTCAGANISVFSDLSTCLPAPSCVAQSVTFQLRFYRDCFGAVGCSGTCIGANSPFTIVIEGHTVEFTNLVTPITVSSNTVCAGGNITGTTAVQYGVPTRTVSWQALPGPIAGGTGNTTNINFPVAGTYSIVATATDACAVTTSAQVIVTVAAVPVANAGVTQSVTCTNPSTVLAGSGGGTYSWTGPGAFSSGAQNPTVTTLGIYSLTVNNGSCTSPMSTVQVVSNTTAPTVTATVASSLNCTNLSTQITLTTPVSPASYTTTGPGVTAGSSTSLVTVNLGGTYNFTVTNPANGCKTNSSVAVTQNTSVANVNATVSNSLNCAVSSATISLASSSAAVTYTTNGPGVTGGSTTSLVTVNAGGTYNYTVTNTLNNCITSGSIAVTQNTTPVTATATPAASLNCTTLSTQISINTSTTPLTYTTTGPGVTAGSSTSLVTVNTGGTYNYTVTNGFNQCFSIGTVNVVQNTSTVNVNPSVSNSLNCTAPNATITLNSSSVAVTYTTAGPGVTAGSSTSLVTVNVGGTYNYTVTNSLNGCKTTGFVSITQNTTAPSVTATPAGSLNCTVLSTQISITSNTTPVTYTTNGPGVTAGSSTSLVTVNTGGVYSSTITNTGNGCTFVSTVNVVQSTVAPTPNITNSPTITCLNPTVTVNGSPGAGVTYTWSTATGTIVGSPNNANVNVSGTGVYSLAVTSTSNGCVSTSVATVNIVNNIAQPTLNMGANQTLPCNPSSVQITSTVTPGTATLVWTGPGVCAGTNSSTATACSPGVYTLTATNPGNGCSSTSTVNVAPAIGLTVSINNTGTITCNATSVQVVVTASPTGNTYTWSGPGIVSGQGSASITVNQGGTYSVVVTNTNGCTSSPSNLVIANNASVNPNATVTNSVNCTSTTATINTAATPTAGPYSYTWTGGAVTGATTSAVVVSPTANATYTVLVMNPVNGCTATQVVNVTANTIPPTGLAINPPTFTLSCATPTTVLTATATGAVTYSWSTTPPGAIISGSNTSTAGIQGASMYSVVAIGSNGCISSVQVATVSPDLNAPTFTLSNSSPSITCSGVPSVSITITSTAPVTGYTWAPGAGISGPTNTSSATFTNSGNYFFTVQANNGCVSTGSIAVGTDTNAPTANAASIQPISCSNSVTSIAPVYTPSSNLTYSWTGAGIVGSANGSSVQVNQGGNYVVNITNTLTGCTGSATFAVNGNNVVPSLSVTSSSSMGISCQPGTSTVNLNAASGATNVTYSWNTGATSAVITTSTAGVYTVTVTDASSGCASSATINVPDNTAIPSLTTNAGTLPCGGGSTTLTANSSNSNVVYQWNGSGIVSGSNTANAIVNTSGIYTVTATDAFNGCSATGTLSISQTTVSAQAAADVTTGAAPLSVNFNNTGSSAGTYSWTFGDGNSSSQNNPANTFTATGTYTVILLVTNGSCVDSDSLFIKVLDAFGPIPEIFTPNGDFKNDQFTIPGLDAYPNAKLEVYNRWGNPVYSASPYKNDWDGTPNAPGKTGSGKLPASTYFYILDLQDSNHTVYRGYVQVEY